MPTISSTAASCCSISSTICSDVTRLEAGHHELVETACDLAALLQEAVGLVKVQADRADCGRHGQARRYPAADPGRPARAAADPAQPALQRRQVHAAKGSVRLCCALIEGRPVITVADTGRGVAPEEMKDLFRPFARTAEAKQASTPGTGLGLAIVKSLVELHQGTITMESRLGLWDKSDREAARRADHRPRTCRAPPSSGDQIAELRMLGDVTLREGAIPPSPSSRVTAPVPACP